MPPADEGRREPVDELGWREKRVLDSVPVRSPAPLGSIARIAGLGLTDAMSALGMLDALGLVERRGDGWTLRRE